MLCPMLIRAPNKYIIPILGARFDFKKGVSVMKSEEVNIEVNYATAK